jgi:hypothetical protein
MQPIGHIKLVQIQRFSLKRGEKSHQIYDPSPLQIVKMLQLTHTGVVGIADDGTCFIDIHNAQHPQTHNDNGANDISFNFTSHYATIQNTYGEHVYDRVAGENILIETDQTYRLEDLGQTLAIQCAQSSQLIHLNTISVAHPCLPFSRFTLKDAPDISPQQIKHTLQFLDHGTRGFYARRPDTSEPIFLQAGDTVFTV